MLGIAVLYVIDVQLGLRAARTGLIQLGDPAACFLEVGSAGRDHQNAVEPLDGHDAQCAKQRVAFAQGGCSIGCGCGRSPPRPSGAGRARRACSRCRRLGSSAPAAHQLQSSIDFLDGHILEREHAHRHALQQVHVKGAHHLQPAFGLGARPHHD